LIAPGFEGVGLILMDKPMVPLVPMQLDAATFKVPDEKEELYFTITFIVPCPLTIDALKGAVHM